MIGNLYIKRSLQTTILTDGVRKRRQTAEQYIQANERKYIYIEKNFPYRKPQDVLKTLRQIK